MKQTFWFVCIWGFLFQFQFQFGYTTRIFICWPLSFDLLHKYFNSFFLRLPRFTFRIPHFGILKFGHFFPFPSCHLHNIYRPLCNILSRNEIFCCFSVFQLFFRHFYSLASSLRCHSKRGASISCLFVLYHREIWKKLKNNTTVLCFAFIRECFMFSLSFVFVSFRRSTLVAYGNVQMMSLGFFFVQILVSTLFPCQKCHFAWQFSAQKCYKRTIVYYMH